MQALVLYVLSWIMNVESKSGGLSYSTCKISNKRLETYSKYTNEELDKVCEIINTNGLSDRRIIRRGNGIEFLTDENSD